MRNWPMKKWRLPIPEKPRCKCSSGTARIEFLVQELLQFSRDESFSIERIDVIPLLKDAIQSVVPGWNGTWQLNGMASAFVKADSEKLRRILVNVIQINRQWDEALLISVLIPGDGFRSKLKIQGQAFQRNKVFTFTPFIQQNQTAPALDYIQESYGGERRNISLNNRDGSQGAVLTIHIPKAGD